MIDDICEIGYQDISFLSIYFCFCCLFNSFKTISKTLNCRFQQIDFGNSLFKLAIGDFILIAKQNCQFFLRVSLIESANSLLVCAGVLSDYIQKSRNLKSKPEKNSINTIYKLDSINTLSEMNSKAFAFYICCVFAFY